MVKQTEEKFNPDWKDCQSLEEWAEKMIRGGYIAIVKNMVNSLPDSKKEKYREIYKRVMAEKNNVKAD